MTLLKFIVNLLLVLVTGGLWLIVLIIWKLSKK